MGTLSDFLRAVRALWWLDSLKETLVNARNPLGDTPLMEAAARNDVAFAQQLIRQGANVDDYNWKSIAAPATALMQAAESNAGGVARLLIAHNAGRCKDE